MLWFFERGGERLQCEIRPASTGAGFELTWTSPDGQVHTEHSADSEALTERRRLLEDSLTRDGWKRVGRITPPPSPRK